MKRLQEQERVFKGEITVFLALLFLLMLSLVGALIQSASIHIEKSCKQVAVMSALESVFAEYNRELLEQYDVFAKENAEEANVQEGLQFYGAEGMEHTLERKRLLSDDEGATLYEQGVLYTKERMGIGKLPWGKEYDFLKVTKWKETEASIQKALKKISIVGENPITEMQELQGGDLLTLVAVNPSDVSKKSIDLSELPSKRNLAKGNDKEEIVKSSLDKPFFVFYLAEHFSNKVKSVSDSALAYEMEYLLGGRKSDSENLSKVCEKIMQIRMLANYVSLLSDAEKQTEAKTISATLSAVLLLPELEPVLYQGVLFSWAYIESIQDMRELLDGERIPLIKSGKESTKLGLGYSDYLIGLLLLENQDTLCMRALDLIESNVGIKVDQCMTKATIKSHAKLRMGIEKKFATKYRYQ